MIKLPRKPAKLGTNINGRTEKHGDERVPKIDIKLTTLLTEKQTIALTGESHVVAAWFKTEGGKYADPLLKGFAPYRKEGKYKDSLCVLTVGVNAKKIDLGDVTIKSLVFKPIDKGATQLACTIQATASRRFFGWIRTLTRRSNSAKWKTTRTNRRKDCRSNRRATTRTRVMMMTRTSSRGARNNAHRRIWRAGATRV